MLIKMGKKSSKVLPRGADSANLYIIEEGCQSYLRPISYLAPNLASSLNSYTHFTVNCPATASSSTDKNMAANLGAGPGGRGAGGGGGGRRAGGGGGGGAAGGARRAGGRGGRADGK